MIGQTHVEPCSERRLSRRTSSFPSPKVPLADLAPDTHLPIPEACAYLGLTIAQLEGRSRRGSVHAPTMHRARSGARYFVASELITFLKEACPDGLRHPPRGRYAPVAVETKPVTDPEPAPASPAAPVAGQPLVGV